MSDFWKFNGTHWTWLDGSYSDENTLNFGVQGIPSSTNYPGPRKFGVALIDYEDNLYLFGGNVKSSGINGN